MDASFNKEEQDKQATLRLVKNTDDAEWSVMGKEEAERHGKKEKVKAPMEQPQEKEGEGPTQPKVIKRDKALPTANQRPTPRQNGDLHQVFTFRNATESPFEEILAAVLGSDSDDDNPPPLVACFNWDGFCRI